jgi:hypothetical protein
MRSRWRAGYRVGSSITVRWLQQLPVEGPEGRLHDDDSRLDVVVGRGAGPAQAWSGT